MIDPIFQCISEATCRRTILLTTDRQEMTSVLLLFLAKDPLGYVLCVFNLQNTFINISSHANTYHSKEKHIYIDYFFVKCV